MRSEMCKPEGGLRGTTTVPPDKSISHRALMMAAMAEGTSRLTNLLDSQDVNSTASCLATLGASIDVTRRGGGSFDATVTGWGDEGPKSPGHDLYCGNSGTTTRLLLGMLAGYDVQATLTGDDSLSARPMQRVVEPLAQMGASFSKPGAGAWSEGEITLPIRVHGSSSLRGIEYASPKASAQVKTALMFAGLHCSSIVDLSEPYQSRNHTELMLPAFGVQVGVEPFRVSLRGGQKLHPCDVRVPGDPSSAMFLVVAAALVPGSDITIEGVGLNRTRIAGIEVAKRMGCDIETKRTTMVGDEPMGDVRVKYAPGIGAVVVEPQEVPNLIDEIPVLALLATSARGITTFREVAELRVKESNRLEAIIEGLCKMGATAREVGDDLEVEHGLPHQAALIDPRSDHRLAMTWLVAGKCLGLGKVTTDTSCFDVSFPGFEAKLDSLLGS